MRREEGQRRRKEERSVMEEEVGVFVCPRRPLSSHYQRIRQMLQLYRCWFDSEAPTLIPSSLLSSTTPRQRLLSSSLWSHTLAPQIVCQKPSERLFDFSVPRSHSPETQHNPQKDCENHLVQSQSDFFSVH